MNDQARYTVTVNGARSKSKGIQTMHKYHVLTQSAALALGIIDAAGVELGHEATQAAVAVAAESGHDHYASALAAAKESGVDRWVIDESGDSEFVPEARS